ncbi:ribulose-phosphate 3-epimerase [Vibrio ishigakensis]|uniref:Ribulose-phosphate 3-epimerase n=1 Tax=Vibrio ishigakensis TaxID=1481914 RepID=A0A0B8P033_9VIBR|nr:ribulose-phosphate 3-epimerase [Vibrio ishigakensis]GAM56668.1 ribulose-phosphate 3-epimerase [Vibrio ishigakensis]GAM65891.1 ribulose-phosphate 3-epimerase [Vibrio ishigakensis]
MSKFCPSMMCVDFSKLATELQELEKANVDMLHIDVMDGHFVPNFALGPEDIKAIRDLTDIDYDVHLMLSNPDQFIDLFAALGPKLMYIHAEAPPHLHRTLGNIQAKGIQSGLAINPGTPLSAIEDVLDVTDVILVMSVNPGFAGQKFIPNAFNRIERIIEMIEQQGTNTKIAIDGAISPDVIERLGDKVEYFILGTAGLFGKEGTYAETMENLRALGQKEAVAA